MEENNKSCNSIFLSDRDIRNNKLVLTQDTKEKELLSFSFKNNNTISNSLIYLNTSKFNNTITTSINDNTNTQQEVKQKISKLINEENNRTPSTHNNNIVNLKKQEMKKKCISKLNNDNNSKNDEETIDYNINNFYNNSENNTDRAIINKEEYTKKECYNNSKDGKKSIFDLLLYNNIDNNGNVSNIYSKSKVKSNVKGNLKKKLNLKCISSTYSNNNNNDLNKKNNNTTKSSYSISNKLWSLTNNRTDTTNIHSNNRFNIYSSKTNNSNSNTNITNSIGENNINNTKSKKLNEIKKCYLASNSKAKSTSNFSNTISTKTNKNKVFNKISALNLKMEFEDNKNHKENKEHNLVDNWTNTYTNKRIKDNVFNSNNIKSKLLINIKNKISLLNNANKKTMNNNIGNIMKTISNTNSLCLNNNSKYNTITVSSSSPSQLAKLPNKINSKNTNNNYNKNKFKLADITNKTIVTPDSHLIHTTNNTLNPELNSIFMIENLKNQIRSLESNQLHTLKINNYLFLFSLLNYELLKVHHYKKAFFSSSSILNKIEVDENICFNDIDLMLLIVNLVLHSNAELMLVRSELNKDYDGFENRILGIFINSCNNDGYSKFNNSIDYLDCCINLLIKITENIDFVTLNKEKLRKDMYDKYNKYNSKYEDRNLVSATTNANYATIDSDCSNSNIKNNANINIQSDNEHNNCNDTLIINKKDSVISNNTFKNSSNNIAKQDNKIFSYKNNTINSILINNKNDNYNDTNNIKYNNLLYSYNLNLLSQYNNFLLISHMLTKLSNLNVITRNNKNDKISNKEISFQDTNSIINSESKSIRLKNNINSSNIPDYNLLQANLITEMNLLLASKNETLKRVEYITKYYEAGHYNLNKLIADTYLEYNDKDNMDNKNNKETDNYLPSFLGLSNSSDLVIKLIDRADIINRNINIMNNCCLLNSHIYREVSNYNNLVIELISKYCNKQTNINTSTSTNNTRSITERLKQHYNNHSYSNEIIKANMSSNLNNNNIQSYFNNLNYKYIKKDLMLIISKQELLSKMSLKLSDLYAILRKFDESLKHSVISLMINLDNCYLYIELLDIIKEELNKDVNNTKDNSNHHKHYNDFRTIQEEANINNESSRNNNTLLNNILIIKQKVINMISDLTLIQSKSNKYINKDNSKSKINTINSNSDQYTAIPNFLNIPNQQDKQMIKSNNRSKIGIKKEDTSNINTKTIIGKKLEDYFKISTHDFNEFISLLEKDYSEINYLNFNDLDKDSKTFKDYEEDIIKGDVINEEGYYNIVMLLIISLFNISMRMKQHIENEELEIKSLSNDSSNINNNNICLSNLYFNNYNNVAKSLEEIISGQDKCNFNDNEDRKNHCDCYSNNNTYAESHLFLNHSLQLVTKYLPKETRIIKELLDIITSYFKNNDNHNIPYTNNNYHSAHANKSIFPIQSKNKSYENLKYSTKYIEISKSKYTSTSSNKPNKHFEINSNNQSNNYARTLNSLSQSKSKSKSNNSRTNVDNYSKINFNKKKKEDNIYNKRVFSLIKNKNNLDKNKSKSNTKTYKCDNKNKESNRISIRNLFIYDNPAIYSKHKKKIPNENFNSSLSQLLNLHMTTINSKINNYNSADKYYNRKRLIDNNNDNNEMRINSNEKKRCKTLSKGKSKNINKNANSYYYSNYSNNDHSDNTYTISNPYFKYSNITNFGNSSNFNHKIQNAYYTSNKDNREYRNNTIYICKDNCNNNYSSRYKKFFTKSLNTKKILENIHLLKKKTYTDYSNKNKFSISNFNSSIEDTTNKETCSTYKSSKKTKSSINLNKQSTLRFKSISKNKDKDNNINISSRDNKDNKHNINNNTTKNLSNPNNSSIKYKFNISSVSLLNNKNNNNNSNNRKYENNI